MTDVDLSTGEMAVRLLVAATCGLVIGVERESDGHDAGARTHLLLALGAALFGVVSTAGFAGFVTDRNSTNVTIDLSRVASYVPAGVGFLGAGAILKRTDRVRGLTTAASLWVVAGIGLAAGLGLWPAALIGTGIALVGLLAQRPLSTFAHMLRRPTRRVDSED
jgi:putative Mg2+ transporter-C (MgtC) family protein